MAKRMNARGIERRRTIRLRRSNLLECKLGQLDQPAINIAENTGEYRRAFSLLYEEYLHEGYASPHPSGMLFSVWSLLPSTKVFLFKSYLTVLSTMSHIRDTPLFGLPMDAVFKDELDALRAEGRIIAEIGALATQRVRRWSNLMLFLVRAAYQYARFSGVTDVVAMVNPKHVRFYTQILLFERFAEERFLEKVGAPAVPLRVNLETLENSLYHAYSQNSFETDLHAFFTSVVDPYAQPGQGRVSRRGLDPYSAYSLLRQRPEIMKSLSEEQRRAVRGLFHQGAFSASPDSPMRETMDPILRRLRLEDRDDYTDIAFARNLGLIGYAEQRRLLETRVAIAGLGGVGGSHLMALTRSGIGAFSLADYDVFSPANINRQYGSDLAGFNRPKIEVMVERALSVNPFLDLRCFASGIADDTLEEFLDDADIVVDGLDFFAQDIRRKLFNRALEKGLPVVTAAPAGYSCSLLVFMPGGMNYDRYFGVSDTTGEMERLLRFGMGIAPRATHLRYMDRRFVDFAGGRLPSLDIGCELCAAMTASEVMRIVLTGRATARIPFSCQFDARRRLLRKPVLFLGMDGPVQRLKLAVARRLLTPPDATVRRPPEHPGVIPAGRAVTRKAFRYMVSAGMAAPSGDNVQPWRFSLGENRIDIMLDRIADQSFFNVRQAASLLACGAAVQNMVFAAGSLGLECRTEFFPTARDEGVKTEPTEGPTASLYLTPQGDAFHELMDSALWRRRTNRLFYWPEPVPLAVWERLCALADLEGDALLLHRADKGSLKTLAGAVKLADRIRVERKDVHEHLMGLIHFEPSSDPGEFRPPHLRRGMFLEELRAGPLGNLYLRAVRPWPRMRLANSLGLGGVMPAYSALCMRLSGGAGLICAKGGDEEAIFRAGRALQRVWCALEHHGYAVQPMAGLTLFHLRLRLEGEKAFEARHARLLRKAWEAASAVFAPPEDCVPLLMFRVGRTFPIRQGGTRLDVEEVCPDLRERE